MKTNIIEGNKLIAEFMTGETHNTFYLPEIGQYFNSYGQIEYTETFSPNELKYHSSWDWLMPVVGKCYSMDEYFKYKEETERQFYPSGIELSTKIESVWLACVEFIKWHNQNK